jgi:hypothetical protein
MVENKPRAASLEENSTMTTWLKDELRRISEADDLHVSPLREDGVTYGTPTWIWSVAVEGALTTDKNLVGTKRHYGRRRDGSSLPA